MSACLSCGHQRDSCEICGGDLDDAYMAADTLALAIARAEIERQSRLITGFTDALKQLAYENNRLRDELEGWEIASQNIGT